MAVRQMRDARASIALFACRSPQLATRQNQMYGNVAFLFLNILVATQLSFSSKIKFSVTCVRVDLRVHSSEVCINFYNYSS